jgi:hypothetical protein
VYARPEYLEVLETATPIAQHVRVDFELRSAALAARRPNPQDSRPYGLPRLQAEWNRLRDGFTRDSLPGAHHQVGLRGHLPGIRSWLLWLPRSGDPGEFVRIAPHSSHIRFRPGVARPAVECQSAGPRVRTSRRPTEDPGTTPFRVRFHHHVFHHPSRRRSAWTR